MLDNAIIVLDYSHQSNGRKIFPALLTATATTIAALSLLFFLPDKEQRNLYDFALIVILALISSLVIAYVFLPGLYNLAYGSTTGSGIKKNEGRNKPWERGRNLYFKIIKLLATYRRSFIILIILLFGTPVFFLPDELEGKQWYQQWYNKTLGNNKYQRKVRPYIDKFLGGTLRLFANSSKERSGYRDPEKTKLYVNAQLPVGSTIDHMNSILTDIDQYLSTMQGIDTYVTNVYSGQYGNIVVTFKEEDELSSVPYSVKSKLVAWSQNIGGVELFIHGVGEGFSTGSDQEETPTLRLMMKGYNYEELEKQAKALEEKLGRHERVQKIITDDRMNPDDKQGREYILDLDNNRMALLNTTQYRVTQELQKMAIPSSQAASLIMDDHWYPVILQEKNSDNYSSFDVLNNYMAADSSRIIRTKEAGSIRLQQTAGAIHKENRQYIRNVSFSFIGSYGLAEDFVKKIVKEMADQLPMGFSIKREEGKEEEESSWQRYLLILVLLVSVFFICGIFFESLKRPFYIIVSIPVAFIGVFLAFSAGDFYFDQGGYAAFVMLGGLTANASIFIMHDVIKLRKEAEGDQNNLMTRAVFDRGRTILLTVLATCCGLIPYLTEGGEEVFWFSFAIGTSGGLLFSLFSLFFFLPVLLWNKTRQKN
jgi:multidrug efflux pump subunit AcrB